MTSLPTAPDAGTAAARGAAADLLHQHPELQAGVVTVTAGRVDVDLPTRAASLNDRVRLLCSIAHTHTGEHAYAAGHGQRGRRRYDAGWITPTGVRVHVSTPLDWG